MTESRLQLALSSGLTVTDWTFATSKKAKLICYHSLEPEKAIALLRVHGVPWSTMLCAGAAYFNNLTLLQWLHSHSCPWHAPAVLNHAGAYGSVAMLEWLSTVTDPWSSQVKLSMLQAAGCHSNLPTTKWLKAQGAAWPKSFCSSMERGSSVMRTSWSVLAVKWALASGSGWLSWKCADYAAADKYEDAHFKQQATELLDWAHANGCPCTCGHAQQQQQ
jgi:hypothetical protein